jgi:hypothetical protein
MIEKSDLSMRLGDRSQLDSRFAFITVIAILISGFAATFGYGLGVNVSNDQESDTVKRQPSEIINEVKSLLDQTMTEYQNENFSRASALAEEAYLENYEFIKASLAEQDVNLMEEIEIMLRGQLRDQVKGSDPDADVPRLVEELNSNLDKAAAMLADKTENN